MATGYAIVNNIVSVTCFTVVCLRSVDYEWLGIYYYHVSQPPPSVSQTFTHKLTPACVQYYVMCVCVCMYMYMYMYVYLTVLHNV